MASKRRYDDDYDYGEYGDSRSRRGSSSRYDDADSGYEDDDSYGRSSGRGYEDDRYEDGRGGYDDRYDDEYDSGYEDDDSYGRSSGRATRMDTTAVMMTDTGTMITMTGMMITKRREGRAETGRRRAAAPLPPVHLPEGGNLPAGMITTRRSG